MTDRIPPLPLLIYRIDRALSGLRLPLRIKQYDLVAQPVPPERLLPAGRGRSIEVRQVDKAEPRLEALPIAPDILERRRNAGNVVCFGAFKDDRLIGCHWIALDHHDDEEVGVRFCGSGAARFAWDFDLYVCPEERLSFAFARIWDEVFEFLRQAGIAWSVSYVSPINRRSQKSHETLGSVRVASFLRVALGRAELIASTVGPRLAIAVPPSRMVEMAVPVPVAKDATTAASANAIHPRSDT